jgi:hypothetical protein
VEPASAKAIKDSITVLKKQAETTNDMRGSAPSQKATVIRPSITDNSPDWSETEDSDVAFAKSGIIA